MAESYPEHHPSTGRFLLHSLVALAVTLGLILAGLALHFNATTERLREQTEQVLSTSVRNELTTAYENLEQLLSRQQEQQLALHRQAREYLSAHSRQADLTTLQQTLGEQVGYPVDIYLIGPDNVVERTTYAPDLNLDFNQPALQDAVTFLERARVGDKILVGPPTLELAAREFRVYTYSHLGDGWILELGSVSPELNRFFRESNARIQNREAYSAELFFLLWDELLVSLHSPPAGTAKEQVIATLYAEQNERLQIFREAHASGQPQRWQDHRTIVPLFSLSTGARKQIGVLAEIEQKFSAVDHARQTLLWGLAVTAILIVWCVIMLYARIRRTLVRPLQNAADAIDRGRPITLTREPQLLELQRLAEHYNTLLDATHKRIQGLGRRATTDNLTGLSNRARLEEEAGVELHRAARYGRSCALILLDLDHFKSVNDQHGHAAGDQVLKRLGEILKDTTRGSDTPARWGGEEFLILCRDTDLDGAAALAEVLRERIGATPFGAIGHYSASFGVAEFRPGDDFNSLFARADAALYRAKEQGRDRVCGEDRDAPISTTPGPG